MVDPFWKEILRQDNLSYTSVKDRNYFLTLIQIEVLKLMVKKSNSTWGQWIESKALLIYRKWYLETKMLNNT